MKAFVHPWFSWLDQQVDARVLTDHLMRDGTAQTGKDHARWNVVAGTDGGLRIRRTEVRPKPS